MKENFRNLVIRSLTGLVFVAIVLLAMMAGHISGNEQLGKIVYGVFLAVVAAGCMWEFWTVAGKAGFNGRTALRKMVGMVYIAFCMWLMWYFPKFGVGMTGAPLGSSDWRIAPAFIIIVWANDICAYMAGITFGRSGQHKLWERISPKKTWEGFIGGIVGAIVVAAVIGRFWMGANTMLWIFFGLAVALAAVAGDLTESHIKRMAGVKDSGSILPGHGGLLDRFDAMLGAVPVAFIFMLLITLFAL